MAERGLNLCLQQPPLPRQPAPRRISAGASAWSLAWAPPTRDRTDELRAPAGRREVHAGYAGLARRLRSPQRANALVVRRRPQSGPDHPDVATATPRARDDPSPQRRRTPRNAPAYGRYARCRSGPNDRLVPRDQELLPAVRLQTE